MPLIAARARAISPVCHAVDDGGALCGARPLAGRWRPSKIVPINCPSCLLEMTKERYSLCETPTASSMSRLHIRRLGPDGLRKSGVGGARTLCGRDVGWDIQALTEFDPNDEGVCAACRVNFRGIIRRGLGLPTANAVR